MRNEENEAVTKKPKRSRLPDVRVGDAHFLPAGHRGVFANEHIEKGWKIFSSYPGKILSEADADKCENRGYQFEINGKIIDAVGALTALTPDEIEEYMPALVNMSSYTNALFRPNPHNRELELIATRDIHPGDQILASYGDDYDHNFAERGPCYPSPDHCLPIEEFWEKHQEHYTTIDDPAHPSFSRLTDLFRLLGLPDPYPPLHIPRVMDILLNNERADVEFMSSQVNLPLLTTTDGRLSNYAEQPWLRPLHVATFLKNTHWVTRLSNANANPQLPCFITGHTAIHIAALAPVEGDNSLSLFRAAIKGDNEILETTIEMDCIDGKILPHFAIDANNSDLLGLALKRDKKRYFEKVYFRKAPASEPLLTSELNLLGYALLKDRTDDWDILRLTLNYFKFNRMMFSPKVLNIAQLSLALLLRLESGTLGANQLDRLCQTLQIDLINFEENPHLDIVKKFAVSLSKKINCQNHEELKTCLLQSSNLATDLTAFIQATTNSITPETFHQTTEAFKNYLKRNWPKIFLKMGGIMSENVNIENPPPESNDPQMPMRQESISPEENDLLSIGYPPTRKEKTRKKIFEGIYEIDFTNGDRYDHLHEMDMDATERPVFFASNGTSIFANSDSQPPSKRPRIEEDNTQIDETGILEYTTPNIQLPNDHMEEEETPNNYDGYDGDQSDEEDVVILAVIPNPTK